MPKLIIKRKSSFVVQYEFDIIGEGPPMKRRHSCAESCREFRSAKALHGHLRVHPSKGYRGMSRPTKKAPIKTKVYSHTEEVDAEVITAAETLMMLVKHDDEGTKENNHEASASSRPAFHCSVCNRSFDTHQALGGHVASHNKHKKIINLGSSESRNINQENCPVQPRNGADAAHECEVCGKTFDKGGSLGGHKRKHFLERERAKESGGIEPPSAVPTPVSAEPSSTSRPFYLDLNVVPSVEDDSGK